MRVILYLCCVTMELVSLKRLLLFVMKKQNQKQLKTTFAFCVYWRGMGSQEWRFSSIYIWMESYYLATRYCTNVRLHFSEILRWLMAASAALLPPSWEMSGWVGQASSGIWIVWNHAAWLRNSQLECRYVDTDDFMLVLSQTQWQLFALGKFC